MTAECSISSHVLDTATGRPAEGLMVSLYKREGDRWALIAIDHTNADGRIAAFCTQTLLAEGTYKLNFDLVGFIGEDSFYPEAEICFQTKINEHYHIPLLLSPFGYTTYRGS